MRRLLAASLLLWPAAALGAEAPKPVELRAVALPSGASLPSYGPGTDLTPMMSAVESGLGLGFVDSMHVALAARRLPRETRTTAFGSEKAVLVLPESWEATRAARVSFQPRVATHIIDVPKELAARVQAHLAGKDLASAYEVLGEAFDRAPAKEPARPVEPAAKPAAAPSKMPARRAKPAAKPAATPRRAPAPVAAPSPAPRPSPRPWVPTGREVDLSSFDGLNSNIRRIIVRGNELWINGYATLVDQWYHFPGHYYAKGGMLFDGDGDQVVLIDVAHRIRTSGRVRYYPDSDVVVRIARDFRDVGLHGSDLYLDGRHIGTGYYFHEGLIYNSRGRRVVEVDAGVHPPAVFVR